MGSVWHPDEDHEDLDERVQRYALNHPREFLRAADGSYSNAEWLARLNSAARHPSTPDPLGVLYEEIKEARMTPLNVHVDVLDLLEHFDDNEERTFEFLGKLRDLLG